MNKEAALRKRLVELLRGKGAHVAFEEALGNFPEHLRGKGVAGIPYTAGQILEQFLLYQFILYRGKYMRADIDMVSV